ncbi:MAG: hypothetical protein WCJ19_05035 [bacterium]
MIHTNKTLKYLIRKKYKKLVLFSGHDNVFHFLFGFGFTYGFLFLIFLLESIFASLNILEDNHIVFYIGMSISIVIAIFFEYLLFNRLDDINETHNQFALAAGTATSIILFFALDLINFTSSEIMFIDIFFLCLSFGLLIIFFFHFWKDCIHLIFDKLKKIF